MSAVISTEATAPLRRKTKAAPVATFSSIIERLALDPAISMDRLDKMIAHQRHEQEKVARLAYDRAMTCLQPDLPVIGERGEIKGEDGKIRSTYAEWEDINEAIRPLLADNGFNLTFRVVQSRDGIGVTAVCAHDEGHREETTIWLSADASGDKNGNQARASATSYAKRYTATLLLNLTSRGEDDDAVRSTGAAAEPRITSDQAQKIRGALKTYGRTDDKLAKLLKIATLEDLPASKHDDALALVHSLGRSPILRTKEEP